MAKIDEVYSYLLENYGNNEPIFLSELEVPGMKPVSLRQQLKKLTEDGRLKRFDTGIYYFPSKQYYNNAFRTAVSYDALMSLKQVLIVHGKVSDLN